MCNKWISVEDELPEEYTQVIILYGKQVEVGYLFSDGSYTTKEHYWQILDRTNAKLFENVTHWQPLPEPPNNESEQSAYS